MMQFDRISIGRQAKKYGFVRDTFEKVYRLVEVLDFMENNSLLSKSLALKGGTAINISIFDLPRLSVDIDLDYSQNVEKEQMMIERNKITNQIHKQMTANGYTLSSKSKQYFALDSFVYEYENLGSNRDNLKIEINYMLRCHILPLIKLKTYIPWEENSPTILHVDPLEIFSAKTVALLNRAAPRDLYDIYNMIQSVLIDSNRENLFRKCVAFYSAIASDQTPDTYNFASIDRITNHKIRTELMPVLRNSESFNLKEAQEKVKSYLTDVLKTGESELHFWKSFQKGVYKPEILFEEYDILSRIKNHPMAMWKCRKTSK